MTLKEYLKVRMENPCYKFKDSEINDIYVNCILDVNKIAPNSSLTNIKSSNEDLYTKKDLMDGVIIELYNEVMGVNFKINSILDISQSCDEYQEYYNKRFPHGYGSKEIDNIRFITTFSKSGLYGIQSPTTSKTARDSIKKSMSSHYNANVFDRFDIFDELNDVWAYVSSNNEVMKMGYETLIMTAKMSSSSIKGESRNFRDYVFEHSYDEIMNKIQQNDIPYEYYAGTRLDRRGKFRLIFSCNAIVRAVDHMLMAGSYNLFDHNKGYLRNFSTEGLSTESMWRRMKSMVKSNDYSSVCTDYTAYDAQFGPRDYQYVMYHLNKSRFNDNDVNIMYRFLNNWLDQPKPLVKSGSSGKELILPLIHTLPSGLKATHSLENLFGIATHRKITKMGVDVKSLIVNGDDQNALVRKDHLSKYVSAMESLNLKMSPSKSLMGHELSVWSKKWYTKDMEPMWELGSIRSLTETEGSQLMDIEDSKVFANYGAILKVGMMLLRMGKEDRIVLYWLDKLSKMINVRTDLIPISLNEVVDESSFVITKTETPKGLESVKSKLDMKTLPYKILGVNSTYKLLEMAYKNRNVIKTNPDEIKYYDNNFIGEFKSMHNYQVHNESEIPYNLRKVIIPQEETIFDYTSRQFINCTGSYDGIVNQSYLYNDMLTLCKALNARNKMAWKIA